MDNLNPARTSCTSGLIEESNCVFDTRSRAQFNTACEGEAGMTIWDFGSMNIPALVGALQFRTKDPILLGRDTTIS
jgi:hypothetical protein